MRAEASVVFEHLDTTKCVLQLCQGRTALGSYSLHTRLRLLAEQLVQEIERFDRKYQVLLVL